jgi:dienelactone hydrolase
MRPLILAALTLGALVATPAAAEVKTKEIEYTQGSTKLLGFAAWDDAQKGKRPGVLIVHEWWGHNQHARNAALRLAKAGYVGFALDMFGKGKLATHPKDAQAFVAEATKDPVAEKARFDLAVSELKKLPQVDDKKIAAIGYCFGGGVVLDMVRAGEDLVAAATFHGALSPRVGTKGPLRPRILVMTGADDPMIGQETVDAFKKEMTGAHAVFEVVSYPGAKHSFTNPDADKAGVPGLAYNAKVDQESWAALLRFLQQSFSAS